MPLEGQEAKGIVIEDTEGISQEVKDAAIEVISKPGKADYVDPLCKNKAQSLYLIQKLIGASNLDCEIVLSPDEEERVNNSRVVTNKEISNERIVEILDILGKRYKEEGKAPNWGLAKAALRLNREALWAISRMEEEGHKPNIYWMHRDGFHIGTMAPSSPKGYAYDARQGEMYLRGYHPWDRNFKKKLKGTAVEKAASMGARLMTFKEYAEAYKKEMIRGLESIWILTPEPVRNKGEAYFASPKDGGPGYGTYFHPEQGCCMQDTAFVEIFGPAKFGIRLTVEIPWPKV